MWFLTHSLHAERTSASAVLRISGYTRVRTSTTYALDLSHIIPGESSDLHTEPSTALVMATTSKLQTDNLLDVEVDMVVFYNSQVSERTLWTSVRSHHNGRSRA